MTLLISSPQNVLTLVQLSADHYEPPINASLKSIATVMHSEKSTILTRPSPPSNKKFWAIFLCFDHDKIWQIKDKTNSHTSKTQQCSHRSLLFHFCWLCNFCNVRTELVKINTCAEGKGSYFGNMVPQEVENSLTIAKIWLVTPSCFNGFCSNFACTLHKVRIIKFHTNIQYLCVCIALKL